MRIAAQLQGDQAVEPDSLECANHGGEIDFSLPQSEVPVLRSGHVLEVYVAEARPVDRNVVLDPPRFEEMDMADIAIGSRLEPFLDDHLCEEISGGVDQRLHHPVPREVVLRYSLPCWGREPLSDSPCRPARRPAYSPQRRATMEGRTLW